MASNKEASHPQEAKNKSTQEEEGLIGGKQQTSEIITRMLQSQHQHVHGALAGGTRWPKISLCERCRR